MATLVKHRKIVTDGLVFAMDAANVRSFEKKKLPTQIADLKLWLDAEDLSVGAVSQWNDKSGNNYQVTQSTGSLQPVCVANSIGDKNAVLFDGVDDYLQTDYTPNVNEETVFLVFKLLDTFGNNDVPLGCHAGNNNKIDFNGYTITWRIGGISSLATNLCSASNPCPFYNSMAWARSNSSGETKKSVNGASMSKTTATTAYTSVTAYQVGARGDGGSPWDGEIAEVIIYDRYLDDDEILLVNNYLRDKYDANFITPLGTSNLGLSLSGDISLSDNDGLLINGATYDEAVNGGIIEFDGVDDYISIPASSKFNFGTGDFTIQSWINWDAVASTRAIVGLADYWNTAGGFMCYASSLGGIINLWYFDGVSAINLGYTAGGSLPVNEWVMVTVVRSGANADVYINTDYTNVSTALSGVSLGNATGVTRIGSNHNVGANNFNGKIPLVAIYDRALTSDEVLQNYNANKIRFT